MMTKDDVDKFAAKRPFEPFEIQLVGGRRYQFKAIEQFIVGRTTMVTTDRRGDIQHISIGLIETIGPLSSRAKRRPGFRGKRH